jgi:hypothetical protein
MGHVEEVKEMKKKKKKKMMIVLMATAMGGLVGG